MNDVGSCYSVRDSVGAMLAPAAVAVVGVSSDQSKLGSVILRNILACGFPGRVYAVARERIEVGQKVSVVESLDQVEGKVDVALFAVPAAQLLAVLKRVPQGKIGVAVAIASGFSEAGESGRTLEAELREFCASNRIALIGPNCQGVVVPGARLQMTFSSMFERMVDGSVAVVAQSGALGAYMVNRLMKRGIGVRCFISSGNETDLQAADYIEALGADPQTKVILCYLEQVRDGPRFLRAVRSLPRDKRVVAIKSGRTRAGSQAATTHTGAIASDDAVVSGVLQQLGVFRANDSAAAVDAASALAGGKVLKGRRVGILSIAGGLAVELADLLELRGLEVPEFSESTQAALRRVVPTFGAVRNPIDLTATVLSDGTMFKKALTIIGCEDVDAIAVISTYVDDPRLAQSIVDLDRSTDKPVVVCWTGTVDETPVALRILADARIPVFDSTGRTAIALEAHVADLAFSRHNATASPAQIPADAMLDIRRKLRECANKGRTAIHEADAKELLAIAGLPIPPQTGYSGHSVVKYCSDGLLHKSDFGLVELNVPLQELEAVSEKIKRRATSAGATEGRLLVEAMVPDGLLEWFVGFKQDKTFGPIVVIGAGGIFAEVVASPQIRCAPIDRETATEMIESHVAFPAISGARNRPSGDIDEFARILSLASRFFSENSDLIAEMDLNPVIVRAARVRERMGPSIVIADAAIKLFKEAI